MIFSSHDNLSRTAARFRDLKIPLVLAVTPVPREVRELPLVEFPAPKCTHCGAFATPNYLRSTFALEWRCAVCYSLNRFKPGESGFHESPQSKVLCYDGRIRKDDKLETVDMNPLRVVFAVEKSKETVQSGLFNAVIAQARTAAATLNCPVAFATFDKHLRLPLISKDRVRFSTTRLADDDYRAIPSLQRVFFSLPEERDLFESYLKFLEDEPEITDAPLPLDRLVDCLGPLTVNDSTVIVYSSAAPLGTFEKLETIFEPKSMSVHFRILKDTLDIPDSQPLSRFATATNSSVEIIDYAEIPYIPNREIPVRAMRVLINVCISDHFLKIKEMHGRGRQSSPYRYTLTSASYNDTVYFTLDYNRDLVLNPFPIDAITIQFQVRCFDKCGLCVFRILNAVIPITESFEDLVRGVNMDVVMASMVVKRIASNKKDVSDPYWLKFISAQAAMRMQRSIRVFSKPGFMLPLVESRLVGATPFDIACYMAPTAYKLELGSPNAIGPHLLSGISSGALLVNYSSTTCLLYVHESEDVNQWLVELQSGPVSTVVAEICRGRCVFIVSRESTGHMKQFIHHQMM